MENSISLSLSSIPTFLINLNESPERLHKSTQILNSINQPFQRFEGIKHSTGVIGCGLSHLTLLRGLNPMTLILEDDIGFITCVLHTQSYTHLKGILMCALRS